MRRVLVSLTVLMSACASPNYSYPSLQPREAEKIDPRVAVVRPMNDRPATAVLTARLASLVDDAIGGDRAFDSAAINAEHLAASAGAPQSESWIAAQEALTAAIAARKVTSSALSDIDEIGAKTLQNQGGIAPNDLAAIDRAAATVAAIDHRQVDRIRSIQKRLGL